MIGPCRMCGNTGWVCEAHTDRPWSGEQACGCGEPGMPCKVCNPCGGIDDPPGTSRLGFEIEIDEDGARH
jgi:hypothetical protein